MCIKAVVYRRPCFLGILHPFWFLWSFCLLRKDQFSLILDMRNLMETSHLGLHVPSALTRCISSVVLSVFAPMYCRREHLWWWLGKALISEYSRMSSRVILLLRSFSRTMVFGFPLGPRPISGGKIEVPVQSKLVFPPNSSPSPLTPLLQTKKTCSRVKMSLFCF